MQRFDLRTNLCAVIDSSDQHGERAAAMRQADLQFRMAIQHAAKDQVAGGQRGVEWIAQKIRKIPRFCALASDCLQRMQEHRQSQLLDLCKNRLEERSAQSTIV